MGSRLRRTPNRSRKGSPPIQGPAGFTPAGASLFLMNCLLLLPEVVGDSLELVVGLQIRIDRLHLIRIGRPQVGRVLQALEPPHRVRRHDLARDLDGGRPLVLPDAVGVGLDGRPLGGSAV